MTDVNLKLWNDHEETPPDMVKWVDVRGGYAAIDAYTRIKQATEAWGYRHTLRTIAFWSALRLRPSPDRWSTNSVTGGFWSSRSAEKRNRRLCGRKNRDDGRSNHG